MKISGKSNFEKSEVRPEEDRSLRRVPLSYREFWFLKIFFHMLLEKMGKMKGKIQ